MPTLPCPCPRPPGLTDEQIRRQLVDSDPRRVPWPEGHVWHVVEWKQCHAVSPGTGTLRCHLRRDHDGFHKSADGTAAWNLPALNAVPDEPTWIVPCWTETQEEAEQWVTVDGSFDLGRIAGIRRELPPDVVVLTGVGTGVGDSQSGWIAFGNPWHTRIHPDGRVELAPGVDPGDAGRQVWEAVQRIARQRNRFPGDVLEDSGVVERLDDFMYTLSACTGPIALALRRTLHEFVREHHLDGDPGEFATYPEERHRAANAAPPVVEPYGHGWMHLLEAPSTEHDEQLFGRVFRRYEARVQHGVETITFRYRRSRWDFLQTEPLFDCLRRRWRAWREEVAETRRVEEHGGGLT